VTKRPSWDNRTWRRAHNQDLEAEILGLLKQS